MRGDERVPHFLHRETWGWDGVRRTWGVQGPGSSRSRPQSGTWGSGRRVGSRACRLGPWEPGATPICIIAVPTHGFSLPGDWGWERVRGPLRGPLTPSAFWGLFLHLGSELGAADGAADLPTDNPACLKQSAGECQAGAQPCACAGTLAHGPSHFPQLGHVPLTPPWSRHAPPGKAHPSTRGQKPGRVSLPLPWVTAGSGSLLPSCTLSPAW